MKSDFKQSIKEALLKSFFLRIKNEIEDSDDQANSVLTKIYTDILYDNGTISDYELLYFEKEISKNSNIKINGYSFSEEDLRLDLFITHYDPSEKIQEIKYNNILELIETAKNFYLQSTKKLYEKINKKEDAYDISKSIYKNLHDITTVRIFVLTNCKCEKTPPMQRVGRIEFQNYLLDLRRIYSSNLGGPDSTNIRIDFTKFREKVRCMLAHKTPDKISSYMAFIPGEVLYNIYRLFGQRLLNLNVRSFLQLGTKINKGIKETLLNEPERFFSYNNGIVVVVDSIEVGQDKEGSFLKSASGFQIVNGGQTTATLFRTKKQNNKVNFSNVVVPTKITLIKKENLSQVVPKISEYANTQNVVKKADFSSSHPFHISIKDLSKKIRTSEGHQWFYERMRGEYQMQKMKQKDLGKNKKSKYLEVSPSNMKFTKEDLAKFINCWHYLDPHVACTGAQKSFVTFMNSLNDKKFHEKLDDDFFRKYCSISILFNKTTKVIRDNNEISGYRSQVLNYTISLLSYQTSRKINFDIIWGDQNISQQLQDIIKSWSFKIYEIIQKTARGKNISEWCKKEECWEDIMDRSFTFTNTPPEFTNLKKVAGKPIKVAKEIFSPEDMDNIKKCKSLSTKDWESMIAWAHDNDEIHYIQTSIAISLMGQALGNWRRQPSPKQAKSVIKLITKAEEAEII
jgi:hypothetical protein